MKVNRRQLLAALATAAAIPAVEQEILAMAPTSFAEKSAGGDGYCILGDGRRMIAWWQGPELTAPRKFLGLGYVQSNVVHDLDHRHHLAFLVRK